MSVRTAYAPKSPQKVQRELEDLQLVLKARNGSTIAMDQLMRRYTSFVRLKASSYFLAGGDSEDLIQEGLVGLYKAVRDFRPDKETSFRSFAELCVTRQIITAIKTATRFKHAPLNQYVSFSHTPAGQEIRAGLQPDERRVAAHQLVHRHRTPVPCLQDELQILKLSLNLLRRLLGVCGADGQGGTPGSWVFLR